MANKRSLSRRSFLQMTMLGLGASLFPATSAQAVVIDHPTAGTCITPAELQLGQLINQYRAEHGLPAIPISKSLTTVAQLHVIDLMVFSPNKGTDSRGKDCNMHSWSANGPWNAVCYTSDHHYASGMWNKPKEITGGVYNSAGYEISYYVSGNNPSLEPARALNAWKNSSSHNYVMLNQNGWDDLSWRAMGIGICGNYATVWFGEMTDPLGTIEACSVVNQPNRVFLPVVRR